MASRQLKYSDAAFMSDQIFCKSADWKKNIRINLLLIITNIICAGSVISHVESWILLCHSRGSTKAGTPRYNISESLVKFKHTQTIMGQE